MVPARRSGGKGGKRELPGRSVAASLSRSGTRRKQAVCRALLAPPCGRRHAAALHLQASKGGASRSRESAAVVERQGRQWRYSGPVRRRRRSRRLMAHRRCGARHTNGCANGQEGLRARCRWGSRGGVGPEAGSPAPWHAVLPEVVRRCGGSYDGGGGSRGSRGSCDGGGCEGSRLERHDGVRASSRLLGPARLIQQQVDDARGGAPRQAELRVGLHEPACGRARRASAGAEQGRVCQCGCDVCR